MEVLEARHERELADLRQEMRERIKKAKKSEKAVAEAQAIQMEFDMKARHREEIEDFEERGVLPADIEATPTAEEAPSTEVETKIDEEQLKAEQKKEKAKRKKDKKAQKEKEKEEEKEQILASGAGIKTARDIEIEELEAQLSSLGLAVKDIPSDGHCLYRAIADQLRSLQLSLTLPDDVAPDQLDFKALRSLAAEHLRQHREEFAPFLGLEPHSADYEEYCHKVQSHTLAEWGGQLEIRALCEALGVCVVVYTAGSAAPLEMGERQRERPVRLSFHRHLFRLGEHYNAVVDTTTTLAR